MSRSSKTQSRPPRGTMKPPGQRAAIGTSGASILASVERLRAEKAQAAARVVQDDLARLLDLYSPIDTLDALRAARYAKLLSGGPKVVMGVTPASLPVENGAPWVGVVIWARAAGYTGYRHLRVIGVWAVAPSSASDAAPLIHVGARMLPFRAPFYEAEAYHKLMRRGFETYYQDDGAPPAAHECAHCEAHSPDDRLARRARITTALASLCG